MSNVCVIFGGTGYIGSMLARRFSAARRFGRIVLADLRQPSDPPPVNAAFEFCDVRRPLPAGLPESPEWIFNLAAVHREPGHAAREYFDTNMAGARHVCAYAERTGCRRLFFTSSIAVYGPRREAADETSPLYPETPYGISKMGAELIHESWLKAGSGRRLAVCRPAVIYGPGEMGNIRRMLDAARKGRFFLPAPPGLRKSYGYIHGLLDSMEFVMERDEPYSVYNYAETPAEPLGRLVRHAGRFFGRSAKPLRLPLPALLAAAWTAQKLTNGRSSLHPARVRKAATPTHIVPKALMDRGFSFRFDFVSSLEHWRLTRPDDFPGPAAVRGGMMRPSGTPAAETVYPCYTEKV